MRAKLKALLAKASVLLPEPATILGLIGFSAFIYGVWQIHRPSAWIISGLMVLAYAVLLTADKKRKELMSR
jgi:hypothetical protein